jgi:hypothetical protein
MTPHTALLCSDAFFMAETNMPRHQKQIKTMILAHTTTLTPLHDSAHWLHVIIDTTTMAITFHNSAGIWATEMKTTTLTLAPSTYPRAFAGRPRNALTLTGRTKCGTHTLFNMIAYTTNNPHPDHELRHVQNG